MSFCGAGQGVPATLLLGQKMCSGKTTALSAPFSGGLPYRFCSYSSFSRSFPSYMEWRTHKMAQVWHLSLAHLTNKKLINPCVSVQAVSFAHFPALFLPVPLPSWGITMADKLGTELWVFSLQVSHIPCLIFLMPVWGKGHTPNLSLSKGDGNGQQCCQVLPPGPAGLSPVKGNRGLLW